MKFVVEKDGDFKLSLWDYFHIFGCLIKSLFIVYIARPILREWNYFFHHIYVPDNERNRALLKYMMEVAQNPERQPETPTEIFFENSIKDDFEDECADQINDEWNWNTIRPAVYIDMINDMLSHKWIDERKYNEE